MSNRDNGGGRTEPDGKYTDEEFTDGTQTEKETSNPSNGSGEYTDSEIDEGDETDKPGEQSQG